MANNSLSFCFGKFCCCGLILIFISTVKVIITSLLFNVSINSSNFIFLSVLLISRIILYLLSSLKLKFLLFYFFFAKNRKAHLFYYIFSKIVLLLQHHLLLQAPSTNKVGLKRIILKPTNTPNVQF